MLKFFSWTIAIVLFCWGTFGLLSTLSDLKFTVDAVDWSVGHLSILYKDILLEIGKKISETVSGYRELVRGIARLLHLPHLPSWAYDALGMASLSIGRGHWIGKRASEKWNNLMKKMDEDHELAIKFDNGNPPLPRGFPLQNLVVRMSVVIYPPKRWLGNKLENLIYTITSKGATVLVYGGAVAIVLAVLFGID
jgi:hypothetical protein